MVGGPRREEIERLSTDAACGNVDDPEECFVVARIPQEPQPGDNVADFPSLEELDSAEKLIRDAPGTKRDLEGTGERISPEEDREIARGASRRRDRHGDFVGDPFSLFVS